MTEAMSNVTVRQNLPTAVQVAPAPAAESVAVAVEAQPVAVEAIPVLSPEAAAALAQQASSAQKNLVPGVPGPGGQPINLLSKISGANILAGLMRDIVSRSAFNLMCEKNPGVVAAMNAASTKTDPGVASAISQSIALAQAAQVDAAKAMNPLALLASHQNKASQNLASQIQKDQANISNEPAVVAVPVQAKAVRTPTTSRGIRDGNIATPGTATAVSITEKDAASLDAKGVESTTRPQGCQARKRRRRVSSMWLTHAEKAAKMANIDLEQTRKQRLYAVLDMGDMSIRDQLRKWAVRIPDWRNKGMDLKISVGKSGDILHRKGRLLRHEGFHVAASVLDCYPRPVRPVKQKRRSDKSSHKKQKRLRSGRFGDTSGDKQAAETARATAVPMPGLSQNHSTRLLLQLLESHNNKQGAQASDPPRPAGAAGAAEAGAAQGPMQNQMQTISSQNLVLRKLELMRSIQLYRVAKQLHQERERAISSYTKSSNLSGIWQPGQRAAQPGAAAAGATGAAQAHAVGYPLNTATPIAVAQAVAQAVAHATAKSGSALAGNAAAVAHAVALAGSALAGTAPRPLGMPVFPQLARFAPAHASAAPVPMDMDPAAVPVPVAAVHAPVASMQATSGPALVPVPMAVAASAQATFVPVASALADLASVTSALAPASSVPVSVHQAAYAQPAISLQPVPASVHQIPAAYAAHMHTTVQVGAAAIQPVSSLTLQSAASLSQHPAAPMQIAPDQPAVQLQPHQMAF